MSKKRKPHRLVWKRKRSKISNGIQEDRLSTLPHDILVAILSRLTMKEAARTSVLSHKWKQLWHCYPNLSFEDPKLGSLMNKDYRRYIRRERPTLIKRVNAIVTQHTGPAIDGFKVIFNLDHEHRSHIDKWIDFAFKKHVKSLHLQLKPYFVQSPSWIPYTLQLPLQNRHHNLSTLKSLCLAYVHVSDEMLQCFLSCFPLLDDLGITRADNLCNIRSCSSLHLKHLEVANCGRLKVVDLCVPQLLSFNYEGHPLEELHLRNASSLSGVSVSSLLTKYPLAYTFHSFLNFHSQQLEFLQLEVVMQKSKFCMGASPRLWLPNLKHLSLYVHSEMDSTLAGWAPLITASPVLQKLTLKFEIQFPGRFKREKAKFDLNPLNCLKTLEIVGFKGYCVDQEFAMYVVENTIVLEEVIINPRLPFYLSEECSRLGKMGEEGVLQLKGKLPKTAKLIVI